MVNYHQPKAIGKKTKQLYMLEKTASLARSSSLFEG